MSFARLPARATVCTTLSQEHSALAPRSAYRGFSSTPPASSGIWSSSSSSPFRRPASSSGQRASPSSSLARGGGLTLALTLPFGLSFSTSSTSSSSYSGSSSSSSSSQSSSLFRAAIPGAPRSQATTLVFCTVQGEGAAQRHAWQDWINYFREAGFDCIDLSIAAEHEASGGGAQESSAPKDDPKKAILAQELTSQLRLAMTQRAPLLFIHTSASPPSPSKGDDALTPLSVLHTHVTTKPYIAGLVVVSPTSIGSGEGGAVADLGSSGSEKLEELKKKLGGRVVVVGDDEAGIREGERWLIAQGF